MPTAIDMKIGIYISDILFRTGGTEAYCGYILYALQQIYDNPEITLVSEKYKDTIIPEINIAAHLNSLFGLSIKNSDVKLDLVFADKTNFIKRAAFEYRLKKATKKFEIFINCSMNLFVFSAKYNVAIIHFPQYRKTQSAFAKKYPFMHFSAWLKDFHYAHNYNLYIVNSLYTQKWLGKIWNIDTKKTALVYPAVSLVRQPSEAKSNSIFVCSRIEKSKEIETLIAAYLSSEILQSSFTLVIAGAVIKETSAYVQKLRDMTGNNSELVVLHENPSRGDIENYYTKAKIFWHAKGYSVNEDGDPFNLEHFGITTVEAMSAGCVPVVINKGGQKEIVDEGINGFRWNTPAELIEKTAYLMQHENERKKMAVNAIEKAKQYSLDNFTRNFGEALKLKL